MCVGIGREKTDTILIDAGCRLIFCSGTQDFHFPAQLGQLPSQLPNSLHVSDHRGSVRASDDQDSAHHGSRGFNGFNIQAEGYAWIQGREPYGRQRDR